jgi:hypothetical protein
MDWQQIAALAIVAAAFLWLLRTYAFARKKGGGCPGCSSCPTSETQAGRSTLIAIDGLTEDRR